MNLGELYREGQGVPQDYAEALRWYQRVADHREDVWAMQAEAAIAYLYHDVQGYAEALKWYQRAANRGFGRAQIRLGEMYRDGRGCAQDYVQAYMWFNVVASRLPQGKDRDEAVENRDRAAEKMTPSQIAEAQHLVRGLTKR